MSNSCFNRGIGHCAIVRFFSCSLIILEEIACGQESQFLVDRTSINTKCVYVLLIQELHNCRRRSTMISRSLMKMFKSFKCKTAKNNRFEQISLTYDYVASNHAISIVATGLLYLCVRSSGYVIPEFLLLSFDHIREPNFVADLSTVLQTSTFPCHT